MIKMDDGKKTQKNLLEEETKRKDLKREKTKSENRESMALRRKPNCVSSNFPTICTKSLPSCAILQKGIYIHSNIFNDQ
jgi:hypothetical protein